MKHDRRWRPEVKKLCSMLMSILLVFTLMPVQAARAEENEYSCRYYVEDVNWPADVPAVGDTVSASLYRCSYTENDPSAGQDTCIGDINMYIISVVTVDEATCSAAGTIQCQAQAEYKADEPDADYDLIRNHEYSVPAKAHMIVTDPAVEATCMATGLTEGSHCSFCGAVLVAQEEVPMKACTPAIDPAVPATCTKPGLTEGSYCSVCGDILSEQLTTEPLGHDWGEWQVTKEPGIGKAGQRQHICSRCGETEKETIAALIGYSVSGEADSSWTKGSSDGISITVNRSEADDECFSHYVETMIDGETVNVSAQEGSTVITISPETLEALSEGEHTVTIRFDDGQTEISLTIEGGESSEEPDSEDPGTAEPDPVDPGSKEPEPKEPGTKDPGSKDPGIKDPGSKDPWPKDPGYKDPGPKKPGPKDPASKDTRSVNIKPKDTVSKASNAAQNASPPTGDGSRPWLWVCLLLLSGVSLAALIITGRKRRAGS